MKHRELARLFFLEVQKVLEQQDADEQSRVLALYRLLNLLFLEATRAEKIQFTTLFARIAFASHKYKLSKQLQFYIHAFRSQARQILKAEEPIEASGSFSLGLKVIAECIASLFSTAMPTAIVEQLPDPSQFQMQPRAVQSFKKSARVLALSDDPEASQLLIRDEACPEEVLRMQYSIADRNENFNPTIAQIRSTFGFPLSLNLLDIEIDTQGLYRPRAIVIEPDHLLDVTAVAECFKDFGTAPLLYLLKKFLPFTASKYLMIGNIANFFLDELMSNPDATFKATFPKVFQLNPLAFAVFEDSVIREIMQNSQKHFIHLKRIVQKDFRESDIEPAHCFLEPSFYSEKYGLQGRLDVFYQNPDSKKQSAIVELKSGKPYRPNVYGISNNHFTQTLLYDLLVKSVYAQKIAPANFILYSGIDQDQLKFAPVVSAQQYEALQIRNQLLALEYGLCQILDRDLSLGNVFNLLHPGSIPTAKGFVVRDLKLFDQVYSNLSELERKYFIAFSSFIAREHRLAKTGIQGMSNINGLAALWLNDFEEKEAQFEIISYLKAQEWHFQGSDPMLTFNKTERTNNLANFRQGDIAILYPYQQTGDTALNNQIFKCTIISITDDQVRVRLRSRQFNDALFQQEGYWNLEHDMLDSGFVSMYRGLFQFAQHSKEKKDLLLCREAPRQVSPSEINIPTGLTEEQGQILRQMIDAQDYFLLWGPPGTGKTSVMLKQIVAYLLNESDEQLLLLAYTNRAVDEICEAIESIDQFARKEYLRIGSRYSTAERFRERLLDSQLAKVNNRQGLKDLIQDHRIFVGTLASVLGKQELLQLKKFDRVIIDEASQILEPMLVGLLPCFERFILIGDHKQLPAVVVQSEDSSAIEDEDLQALGLRNLRDSLFERLYKQAQQKAWTWAFAQLSHQGRMHQDIMAFPNTYFYKGKLGILPDYLDAHQGQIHPLQWQLPDAPSDLEQALAQKRLLFIATPVNGLHGSHKTNEEEARVIAELVQSFMRLYAANDLELNTHSIGIITPYRAQIACIRKQLEEQLLPIENLTIDTVERYQGGARDIILISLCTNKLSQLDSLISLSDEGVDRKLNVALTRARKHLVLVGNPEVLKNNQVYRELIAQG
ncbi:MAG: AAA domain-containing protein [Bacteroidota bacterium]